ncbi:signal peptide peptidase SppA [Pedobacter yulinensis]|uniref:Signal peptide peptidase SppA n=1 Tax=Pedobacter yulinensis TaxID=2126353 RepID=A0A2T3HM64_9SPHI|nr:signal peptide peptidase SppA [Pedobacter yulinensis]PST83503.1 signal peptide peptidase SppA [Pedobacter yulinensis]
MRAFFRTLFATILGFFISIFLLFLVFFVIIGVIISAADDEKSVEVSKNSVLFLNLDQEIGERTTKNPLANVPGLGGEGSKKLGFADVIRALKKAKTDDNIRCVYVNVSAPNAGLATMREVRNAILDFRSSKKQVIAYSEIYTQGAYYLASAADKVYLHPEGTLELKGFSSELTFFKGALEKLGIEAQVIRVGNYKSAVEPFLYDKMSDYNRKQVTAYVNGLYQTFLGDIATARKLQKDSLAQIANELLVQTPADALRFKVVDALRYKDEVLNELKKLSGTAADETISSVTINDYAQNAAEKAETTDRVAVIYANGDITGGEGDDETIGSERISRAIRKARQDKKVKAVVIRVNSPGGSALASDVIWREVVLTRKSKPVIASFGDVAASGGYYIGCAADSIIVQPNTITGSIGVFGIIPNFQRLMNEKLGVTFDGVKTGKYADIMSTNRPMTPAERAIIQAELNRIYKGFVKRVADGRKKTTAYIDSIGGGHVWVGTDAVRIGLADRLGSFQDAIAAAGKKAGLKSYRVVEYPEIISPLQSLLDNSTDKIRTAWIKEELGAQYPVYQQIRSITSRSGILAKMPFEVMLK